MLHVFQAQTKQFCDVLIIETVENLPSLFARTDNTL
jgi:hypothetical protein